MRSKLGKIIAIFLMALGGLCLAGAIALVCYNTWDEKRAEESVTTSVALLNESIPEKQEAQPVVPEVQAMMTAMEVDGRRYVGVLDIPVLDKALSVQAECDDKKLKHSPCLYDGTIYDGMIIAGHNYRSHFTPLKKLEEGDDIYFTDVDGNVWHYQLTTTEVIDGYDIEGMKSGDWDLTLFTCTYGGRERYTLRCTRVVDILVP